MSDIVKEIRVGHLCCGSGFGAKGFRKGNARVGNLVAQFRNIGGVDVDPAGVRDFERFAGVKGTLLDLMSIEQYRAFHGHEPPPGWSEAMPDDIRAAMGNERPHIWFVSAPCKGFSGLLSEKASASAKYQALNGEHRDGYTTQGHYGVVPWDRHSGAVPAHAKNNNGPWSVADPRNMPAAARQDGMATRLPAENDKLVAVIRALDGTWHRPFTTLELAALQSLFDPDEWFGFEMDGASDSAWRERIGNAVPPNAAAAVASVMGRTLLLAWAGESFMLSADPIWVQPLTVALSVDVPGMAR